MKSNSHLLMWQLLYAYTYMPKQSLGWITLRQIDYLLLYVKTMDLSNLVCYMRPMNWLFCTYLYSKGTILNQIILGSTSQTCSRTPPTFSSMDPHPYCSQLTFLITLNPPEFAIKKTSLLSHSRLKLISCESLIDVEKFWYLDFLKLVGGGGLKNPSFILSLLKFMLLSQIIVSILWALAIITAKILHYEAATKAWISSIKIHSILPHISFSDWNMFLA